MPLALTDAELQAVFDACRPLQPRDRDAFLKDLAEEVTRMPVIGPGALHRVIATVQRRHFDPPDLNGNKGAPRHPRKAATTIEAV